MQAQDSVTYPHPRLKRALCDLLNEHSFAMAVFLMLALDAYAEEAVKTGGADVFYHGTGGPFIDGGIWIECAQAVRQALADLKN
jgi:hypothetical protein